jgi:hypothetical protein
MAEQTKVDLEGTFNNSSTGLFKTNTTNDIGSNDLRTLVENMADSVPFNLDDRYTWGSPQVTASGTDTYAATLSPAITAYAIGQAFKIKFTNQSTGASTLNLNGLGAKKIFTNPTTQAGADDIVASQVYQFVYDTALDTAAGGFLMIGSGGGSSSGTSIPYGTTSGTNTYTITATPTVTAYADGLFLIKIGTSSTNASTLNFDSIGALKVYERPNKQITAGDFETGMHYLVQHDSALDGGTGGFIVVGDLNHERLTNRGGYDVSSNLFPSTGGSGPSGGLRTGDFWLAANTGTLGSTAVSNRDLIINIGGSSPGQTEGNWAIISGVASVNTKLALKADLASPALTGTPTAPTAAAGTNTTQLATTEFVTEGLATKSDVLVSFRTLTGSHTLDATDLASVNAGDVLKIKMNVAGANNLTIPLNATQAFPVGTAIIIQQIGAGQTSIVATGGVTINSANGWVKIAYQYASVVITKTATDTWDLEGTLTA